MPTNNGEGAWFENHELRISQLEDRCDRYDTAVEKVTILAVTVETLQEMKKDIKEMRNHQDRILWGFLILAIGAAGNLLVLLLKK